MNREDRSGMIYDKARRFWISSKGVYGTAGWMSDKELAACFDVTPVEHAGEVDEVIYGCKDGKVVSRKKDSMLGPHIAVMGSSGSMKSRTIGRAMLISCAKKGHSLCVTAPKGELAADTMEYLKGYGYEVRVFNVVDPLSSHRYDGLEGGREYPLFVTNIVEAIISNTGGGLGDPIYDAAEGDLLTALIFLQFEREDIEYPTLKSACRVLLDTGDVDDLDAYFSGLLPLSRALSAYNLFRKASDNMRGNICLGLGTRLAVMQNEEIADLMCGSDMDLQMLGQKKMAYFLILSDQDNTTRFVAATFFSLLFLRLVQYADMECPDRNARRTGNEVEYRINEGMRVTARIVHVARNAVRVEVYGFESYVRIDSISNLWVNDIREVLHVGEERPVEIVSLTRDESGRGMKPRPQIL